MRSSLPLTLAVVVAPLLSLAGARSAAAGAPADTRVRGVSSHVIAAGGSHAFAIVKDSVFGVGGTYAWGTDTSYELGNGTPAANAAAPVSITSYSQIAAGKSFTVAIDWAGALWGWGLTDKGQAGTSVSGTAQSTAKKVGSKIWKSLAAGVNHACGITADGNLYCWGDNSMGELAKDPATTAQTATPTLVGATSDRWIAVACGDKFTYAIKANGALYSWGSNSTAGAVSGQHFGFAARAVPDRQRVARSQQATRHRRAHEAAADQANSGHVFSARMVSDRCSLQGNVRFGAVVAETRR